jgi:hypothetical protein
MSFTVSEALVCFIVCHGGPADHFATFAQCLPKEIGIVDVYASVPTVGRFQERGIRIQQSFSVDNLSPENEEALAEQIAKACSVYSVVITDVGHPFDSTMQKALAHHAPHVRRLAYYDNPEPYVPGGYSMVASQVMRAAQGVLFANSHLAKDKVFQSPGEEIDFGNLKRFGVGYYPLIQAEKIAQRRVAERAHLRSQFFLKNGLIENGQKLFVYFGGNNDEYFGKAFPAFLSLLGEGLQQLSLSDVVFVIQQHPGARKKNLDANMVCEWLSTYGKSEGAPKIIISDVGSDDAQVLADGAWYYQTSMGPQFVLAGIPTVQIGHETFQDILVRNNLSPSVTNIGQFVDVLQRMVCQKKERSRDVILESLGIQANWLEILKGAIKERP